MPRRKRAPSILFIDEIDAVGSRENGDRHGSNYRFQVINGFLEEMDSISRQEGVIVLGACNHLDRIDPAVLRAGRFDLRLEVPLPDAASILGILRRHLGSDFGEEALRDLARLATGSTAAEVGRGGPQGARLGPCREGALCLVDLRAKLVARDDRASTWRTAVHECGHAIVAAVLGRGEGSASGLRAAAA